MHAHMIFVTIIILQVALSAHGGIIDLLAGRQTIYISIHR